MPRVTARCAGNTPITTPVTSDAAVASNSTVASGVVLSSGTARETLTMAVSNREAHHDNGIATSKAAIDKITPSISVC